ncbi:MAG: hypothetical protein Kow00133_09430 [Amphiplicatus sp.]
MRALVIALLAAMLCAPLCAAKAETEPGAIVAESVPGGFALVRNGRPATLFVDDADDAGVVIAARNLRTDLAAVGGKAGALAISAATLVGALTDR